MGNDGAGKFTEIVATSLLAPTSGMYFAWWAEYDNDGYLEHWSKVKVQTSAAGTVKFTYVDGRAPIKFYRVLVP
jgi:hypothetical protein